MMRRSGYKAIWIAGSIEGVKTLIDALVFHMKEIAGPDAVSVYEPNTLRIEWQGCSFILRSDSSSCWIIAPSQPIAATGIWNYSLEKLHEDVIVPIKDKIGGVASGIGQLSDEDFASLHFSQPI
jgi:hypothetical protein